MSCAPTHSPGGENSLKRTLGPLDLIALGIGAIIGTGIFVLTGTPRRAIRRPGARALLRHRRHRLRLRGALLRRVRLHDPGGRQRLHLRLRHAGRVRRLDHRLGPDPRIRARRRPPWPSAGRATSTAAPDSASHPGRWHRRRHQAACSANAGAHCDGRARCHRRARRRPTGIAVQLQPPGVVLIVVVITALLVVGIRESARFNNAIVVVKVAVVLVVHRSAHSSRPPTGSARANWHPFIPPQHRRFGPVRLERHAARRRRDLLRLHRLRRRLDRRPGGARIPQRDMPIGILGSLVICTVLYILVSAVLTGLVPYTRSTCPTRSPWRSTPRAALGCVLVKLGAHRRPHARCMLVHAARPVAHLLSPWRATACCRGLRPKSTRASARRYVTTIVTGVFVAVVRRRHPASGILGELVTIGTLLAFVIVCAGVLVLRRDEPERDAALQDAVGALRADHGHPGLRRADGRAAGRDLAPAGGLAGRSGW